MESRHWTECLSPRKQQIVRDAREAGWLTGDDPDGSIHFYTWHNYHGEVPYLTIHANGTAMRDDVRLDLAKGIRSVAEIRKLLKI